MKQVTAALISKFNATKTEADALDTIFSYLTEFPDQLSWQGKRPNLNTAEGLHRVGEKFFNGRKNLKLAHPSTKADSAVEAVLVAAYGFDENLLDEIIKSHQYAMMAENTVGNFLERYIANAIEEYGWCWCSGDLVKATDFIKRNKDSWDLLQIKNRSNSENSSSSAIRQGTKIKKWHRSNSSTGKTRWDKFPAVTADLSLSEIEFLAFIKKTIQKFKNQT